MQVDRKELISELQSVSPGLQSPEIIDQSSRFVWQRGVVWTYNDAISCHRRSCLKLNKVAVEASALIKLLQELPDDSLDITVSKGELRLKGRNRRAGIRIEREIKLPIEMVDIARQWILLPTQFLTAVDFVKGCASTSENEFDLTCVHITPKYIECTDNYQAARYRLQTKWTTPILVPAADIAHLVKLEVTKRAETESWIHFKNKAGSVFSCRNYPDGDYVQLDDIFRAEGSPLTLDKALAEASKRASIFSAGSLEPIEMVSVRMSKNVIEITGESYRGWYSERRKIDYKGKTFEFKIPPSQLSQLAKHNSHCQINDESLRIDGDHCIYITSLSKVEE
jgi:hypothetical protein